MSALAIRLIACGLLALLLVVGASWGVYTLTSHHYERLMAADKLAQDQALQQAQQRVIAAQVAQKLAEDRADEVHALLVKADTASRDAVLGSVRGLEAALSLIRLPTAVGNPGAVPGASPVAGGDPRIAGLVERLNASIERAIGACQHDATELASILTLAPQVTP